MVSTITDRVNGAVSGVSVAAGAGIIVCSNVVGTNSITADTTPAISGYLNPSLYLIRPQNTNTGAVQVNLGQGGLVDLLSPSGAALVAGQFDPALEYIVRFNGVNMRIVSPSF